MHPVFDISVNTDLCKHCGSCAKYCSTGHLRFKDGNVTLSSYASCIGCGHCIAVCPSAAIQLNGQGPVVAPSDTLERILMERRSIRKFLPTPPPKEDIIRALDIAEYAPSGKNRHATRWTVIYGKDKCEAIRSLAFEHCKETGEAPELLKLFDKGLDLLTCNAPVVILGHSPDNALNPVIDTVIALHIVQLQLERKGYGCCWGGYMRQITDHCEKLQNALGIPEGSHMRCCMMTGIPDREHYSNIPPRPRAPVNWL